MLETVIYILSGVSAVSLIALHHEEVGKGLRMIGKRVPGMFDDPVAEKPSMARGLSALWGLTAIVAAFVTEDVALTGVFTAAALTALGLRKKAE